MTSETSRGELHIVNLYPRHMNIYGDRGNMLVLTRRTTWHGLTPVVHEVNPGDELPERADIIVGGGGQDSGQVTVADDLQRHGDALRGLAADGVPMLMICGMYQLFGHRFVPIEEPELPGVGVFDMETVGGPVRMIGNVVAESDDLGTLIGYENHSGRTLLGAGVAPLARVTQGDGNNGDDGFEGATRDNVIGTYLHGSLLPKNPAVADFLIETAARRAGLETVEVSEHDHIERARRQAAERPR